MLTSRFECKYLIDAHQTEAIREMMRVFMEPDPFAARHADLRYLISSLYFDTEQLKLCRETSGGHTSRFKLRIRTYSDDPGDPVFFEIKRRTNQTIGKRRGRIDRAAALRLLDGEHGLLGGLEPDARGPIVEFLRLSETLGAGPMVRVRYRREAWVSADQAPVRITFDDLLAGSRTTTPEFGMRSGEWQAIALPKTILEIKFTEHIPAWVRHLVRVHELQRQSVPKYVLAVDRRAADVVDDPFAIPHGRW
jgi:SPX domain protein involved in polyphosphate accumulation